jgi:hypothetical protein
MHCWHNSSGVGSSEGATTAASILWIDVVYSTDCRNVLLQPFIVKIELVWIRTYATSPADW